MGFKDAGRCAERCSSGPYSHPGAKCSMGFENKEQFRILFLDKRNQMIADEVQQTGTVDHTPVYVWEVVKRALELSATAIVSCTITPRTIPPRRAPTSR